MTHFFADYAPQAHGTPLADVEVVRAEASDLAACGALWAQREGGDPALWTTRLERSLSDEHVMFVARRQGRVLGYGRVAWLTPQAGGGRNAPDGWYLSGVVVDPAYRRRGLGRLLTDARCQWVWSRGEDVWYVVSAGNRASRQLHDEFGFREVTRDFALPGVTFSADDGILCRGEALERRVLALPQR